MKKNRRKVLVVASTFPANDQDKVPAFVKEQVVALKEHDKSVGFTVLAPHDTRSNTIKYSENEFYEEYRFRYFWPRRFERLAGRGILPAIQQNKMYVLIVPFFILSEFFALLRLVIKIKPSIIYAHWFTPQALNSFLVSVLTKTPFVFTTHASDASVLNGVPFSKSVVRSICSRATAYTAVSDRTADKLKHFFKGSNKSADLENKLKIIPMGVHANTYKKLDDGKGSLNKILFLGRLAEKKGIAYLLEAFAIVNESHPETELVIAGDGPLKSGLEARSRELGIYNKTKFVGYVTGDRKMKLLKECGILVVPSIITEDGDAEGLPVVLMEGLSAGMICVATKESGADGVIIHGKEGFLVSEKSSTELSGKLNEVYSLNHNELSNMRVRAIKASRQFGWPKIAREHYDFLFRRLLT